MKLVRRIACGLVLTGLSFVSAEADTLGASAAPPILSPTAPGMFNLSFFGVSAKLYVVETSTDLSTWNSVGPFMTGSGLSLSETVPALSANATFFRVRTAGTDTDNDQLDDAWEMAHFGDLSHTGSEYFGDNVYTNAQEFAAGADPTDRFDTPVSRANPSGGIQFSFTLGADCDTSAGIYASVNGSNYLVKTLWRSVHYEAGVHSAVWDGKDEEGNGVPQGPYQVKVQCSDMTYVWDGVIGNTSDKFSGVVYQSSTGYGIGDISASDDGSVVYCAFGYNEGTYDVRAFAVNAAHHPINILPHSNTEAYALIAVDGSNLYTASIGDVNGDAACTTFVRGLTATNPALGDYPTIAALNGFGQTAAIGSKAIASCADIRTGAQSVNPADHGLYWPAATGLAVQRGAGALLAVAHGNSLQRHEPDHVGVSTAKGTDSVAILNKATGALLATLTGNAIYPLYNPQRVAFASSGDLWVIASDVPDGAPDLVYQYASASLNGSGSISPFPSVVIGGADSPVLAYPLNVAISSDNSTVYIADGCMPGGLINENIQMFSATTGGFISSYGDVGGYMANGPDVSDHRFQFGESVPLLVSADRSFWIGDGSPGRGGTGRLLHIGALNQTLDSIQYLTANSTVACDPNNPTRVFWDFLEYAVDYSQPLVPGNPGAAGAWRLVKNWAAGLNASFYPYRGSAFGLNTVVTLANGGNTSTIALANTCTSPSVNAILQLPASPDTPARILSVNVPAPSGQAPFAAGCVPQQYEPGLNYSLYANGDFRYALPRTSAGVQVVNVLPLASIDVNGAPAWSAANLPTTTARYSLDLATEYGNFGASPRGFPITGSNVLVTFDSAQGAKWPLGRMRLGGSFVGGSGYLWKASPAIATEVPFDGLGSYDLGDGVQSYGGNKAMAIEPAFYADSTVRADTSQHNIIYGYNGESYNGTEANQFMHFSDDGLFVGQFGTPGKVQNDIGPAIAGFGGNSFCPSLVQIGNGEIYLYHNDESNHGGIHRWHLVGANAIFSQEASAQVGAGPASLSLAEGDPDSPQGVLPAPVNLHVTSTSAQSATLSWKANAGAATYNVKVSAKSGGPYTITEVTDATASITLTPNTFSYVCVSAVDDGNLEGRTSGEIRVLPQDPNVSVGLAGCLVFRRWDPDNPNSPASGGFKVNSQAPANGLYSLNIPKNLDSLSTVFPLGTPSLALGALLRQHVGSQGCVIFGGNGATPILSNLVGASIVLSANWAPQKYIRSTLSIDGGAGQQADIHAANSGSSYADITVNDASQWHTLTVFAPEVLENDQSANLILTPSGQSTPAAIFPFKDLAVNGVAEGFNRIIQFRFKGNVRLTFTEPDAYSGSGGISPQNANLQALFLDDAPEVMGQ